MFFLEYLKMIQKKYKISNTELINECANDGVEISKSNLTHKMKGERTISEKELESFIKAISPSIAEEENLRKLYKIYLFGEREYEEVSLIKEYIEGFSDENTVLPEYQNIDLSCISNIEQEESLKNILYTLFSKSWGKNTIKIFCQPECKALIDKHTSVGSSHIEYLLFIKSVVDRHSFTLCNRRVRRGIFSFQGAYATLHSHYIRHNLQSQ